jgi:polyadenylate-binding protein
MWSLRDPSQRRSGVGNIFIRNLDPEIGPKELHDTFSQFGNINSCKVATYPNGQSKGYGYVHFENTANAEQAIKIVHGKRIGSSTVQVTPFVSRQDRLKRIEETWTNVYIKNLDPSIDDQGLSEIFSRFGPVTKCVIMRYGDGDERSNESKGFGFVNFQNHADAVRAVEEMNKSIFMGKELFCCRAQKKS